MMSSLWSVVLLCGMVVAASGDVLETETWVESGTLQGRWILRNLTNFEPLNWVESPTYGYPHGQVFLRLYTSQDKPDLEVLTRADRGTLTQVSVAILQSNGKDYGARDGLWNFYRDGREQLKIENFHNFYDKGYIIHTPALLPNGGLTISWRVVYLSPNTKEKHN